MDRDELVTLIAGTIRRLIPEQSNRVCRIIADNILSELRTRGVRMFLSKLPARRKPVGPEFWRRVRGQSDSDR